MNSNIRGSTLPISWSGLLGVSRTVLSLTHFCITSPGLRRLCLCSNRTAQDRSRMIRPRRPSCGITATGEILNDGGRLSLMSSQSIVVEKPALTWYAKSSWTRAIASAARAVGCGPLFTAALIVFLSQVSPQFTGTPVCHCSKVSPNGCPSTIKGMGCSRLLALSGLPRASFMALGWCISTSCNDTVRCLDSCLILAIWFRMAFVAWGPFRWWASCKLGSFNSGLLVTCLSKPPVCQLRFRFRFMFSTAGPITLTKVFTLSGSARTAWSCL